MTQVKDRYICQYCQSDSVTPERPLMRQWGSDSSVNGSYHEDCQLVDFLPQLEGVARIEALQKILDIDIKRTDAVLTGYAVLGAQLKQDMKNVADLRARTDAAGVAYL